jgi:hypothetical protein
MPVLTAIAGPTSRRQGLQRSTVRRPGITKDILQG